MGTQARLKLMFAMLLVGAAVIGRDLGLWVTGGLLAFGLFNALVTPPGTELVRMIALGATLAALLAGKAWWVLALIVVWLVWPPAYAVAWSFGRRANEPLDRPAPDGERASAARMGVAAIILSVAIASAAYRVFVSHNLQQTSALFIGLPSIIAIVVVLVTAPRTAIGVAIKAVTVGLLISMIFLGEGILCVLMSAPLFYFIAIAIAAVMQRTDVDGRLGTLRSCAALLVLAPMTLEGVTPATTFNRNESVSVSRVVHAPPDAIRAALFAPPRFDRALPFYLRAGFPRALSTRIDRSQETTRWIVEVRGGEMHLDGMEPRTGTLVLALEESQPDHVRWRAVSDTSHMTHFLSWRDIVVRWQPLGPDESMVTWTLRYQRGLDPAWYFGPWERYAVELAAGYLIDAVATP